MQQIVILSVVVAALCAQSVLAVITVQIGGATRLNSLSRQRERYNCYWDCDLVGCQIARDDDECAYDCEKICRIRYDYTATGRSSANGSSGSQDGASSEALQPKSAVIESVNKPASIEAGAAKINGAENADNEIAPELMGGKSPSSSF